MKKGLLILGVSALMLTACNTAKKSDSQTVTISKTTLQDKIAGGWAGKMIGVTYGAPTEFKAQGKTFEDSIKWKPADVEGAKWQDDIYVQVTLMETMEQIWHGCSC